jgi:LacI family gluconate utilization system Gnt-I transcriptional repressor
MNSIRPLRAVTLKDVSKFAGLSLVTVSRALRTPNAVHPETRSRIQEAIDALGYVPNQTARSLVSSRSNIVGLVVPAISTSLFADLAQALAEVLQTHDMQLLLGANDRSVDHEDSLATAFLGRPADAIVLTGFTHSAALRGKLERFSGPVVETFNLRSDPIDMAVGFNNFQASYDMTRYLIGKGYRRIVMASSMATTDDQQQDRARGFAAAMREAGRGFSEEGILHLSHPVTLDASFAAMEEILRMPKRPDAIFFHSEVAAHGATMACMTKGVRLPDEIAIAGFGDLALSAILPVPLTTIRIRSHRIGLETGQLIVERLAGNASETNVVDVGYDLVVRVSA